MDYNRDNMDQPQSQEPTPQPTPQPVTPAGASIPGGSAQVPPPGDAKPVPTQKDSIQMAMLAHLVGIVPYFFGALVIWLFKKDQDPFIDDQGKEALNFQLAVTIVSALLGATLFLAILIPVVMVVKIVFCIIAATQANKGVAYRYPLTYRFIK